MSQQPRRGDAEASGARNADERAIRRRRLLVLVLGGAGVVASSGIVREIVAGQITADQLMDHIREHLEVGHDA